MLFVFLKQKTYICTKFKRYFSMGNIIFDKYGQAIMDEIVQGTHNLVVEAVAGAGKTTIMLEAIKRLSRNKKILFLAFNKSIEEEARAKIEAVGLKNVYVSTFHSLGYSIFRENNKKKDFDIDEYKYSRYVTNLINEIGEKTYATLGKPTFERYRNNIISLVNYGRFNLAKSVEDIIRISKLYNINLVDDECLLAYQVLQWGKVNIDIIDQADMVWLPNELGYSTKQHQYDFMFVDEAQDTSLSQQDLIFKALKPKGRFMAAGERNQCINSWCGADAKAFETFMNRSNTLRFPLPVTRRCSKAVVEVAKEFVPEIEALPNAKEGKVIRNVRVTEPMDGDMVLCRNGAPLIKAYTLLLLIDKCAYIQGGSMKQDILDTLESVPGEKLSVELMEDGVFPNLYRDFFKMRDSLIEKKNIVERDALLSEELLKQHDIIQSLEVLAQGLTTRAELKEKIKRVFDGNKKGIMLSTIHKAKGLEANNVYILCPELMPSRLAHSDWEMEAEKNLQYVAFTRAKENLYFIGDNECSSLNAFQHPEHFIKQLNEIEARLQYISPVINREPKKLRVTKTMVETKNPPKKKIGGRSLSMFME